MQKATLHLNKSRSVDLAGMLQQLRRDYKVRFVACEGGAELFRSLLERDLVDQLNLTIAPVMFGGAAAPTLTGLSKEFLPASVQCSLKEMRTVGDECFLTYRIKHRRSINSGCARVSRVGDRVSRSRLPKECFGRRRNQHARRVRYPDHVWLFDEPADATQVAASTSRVIIFYE